MAHPYWPLFDLEVRTPRLVLRYVDDEVATGLMDLVAAGVHDPGWMPFGVPWTRGESPHIERGGLQYHWRCRAETSPEQWTINFGVFVDDVLVGSTGLMASDFVRMRQFETGSWLGREFQGRGIGTEMRLATLTVGFVGLDADWALTGAWHDNGPSLGVTRRLGYTEQGHRRMVRDDSAPDLMLGFEMPSSHFDEQLRRDDIELVGIDPVRALLGVS